MTGREFIKRVTEAGRKRGVTVRLDLKRGKGSHATLYYGSRLTVIPDRRRDIRPALLAEMLWQIGLDREDI